MKRILFLSLFLLPVLASAQGTKVDSVTVLTDAQVSFGTWADSLRLYFIQGGSFKKQRLDTLAQYIQTKLGTGVTTFNASGTGLTPSTATSGAVTLAGTLDVDNGGTGATTASQARTNLGLGIGTDVLAPNGSAANLTSFPTLNQNTTGSAATLTTARTIQVDLASTSSASFNGSANITPGVTGLLAGTNIATGAVGATQLASTAVSAGTYRNARLTVDEDGRLTAANSDTLAMIIACSDETTNLTTTGNPKVTFRAPFAMTVVGLRANVNTAPTGADIIVDVNKGTSIMTTNLLRITAGQKTSLASGTTQPNITTTAIANDDEITIDIDQIGSTIAGKGLKVTILYIRP